MRMRAIYPDYWKSPKLANLTGDWEAKHLLAAVWSYVDDNGVGLDNPALIAAECFRFEDQAITTPRVAAALRRLHEAGHIDRYKEEVEGTALDLIGVCDWKKWQKPDHPSPPRFPQSDAVKGKRLARGSRAPREKLAAGTGVGDWNTELGDRKNTRASSAGARESGTSPAREDDNDERNRQLDAIEERYAHQFKDQP